MTRQAESPTTATVASMVARQAAATPEAVAVVEGPESITYAELDARANRLANLLRDKGVGPDSVVGVCLHRSVTMVVALLAVWRAGGAYLPLDPAHPGRRTSAMLRAAGAELALTQAVTDTGDAGTPTIVLDRDLTAAAGQPDSAPEVTVFPDSLAYVLYTSGSTGTPKPVLVHQAGIGNHIRWTSRAHDLGPGDRVLHKTAITFDAAGWEIFAPLATGATLVLAPVGAEREPAALVRALAEQRITVLQVVPSQLRALVEEPGWAGCGALRLLSSGGEQLHAELVQRFLALLPDPAGVEVWNTYGPTECTIEVTAHRFDRAQQSGPVPIGHPIDGIHVVIVDEHGAPVPDGATGELLAAGVGVGRGYLGRVAETAERFVPDPVGRPGDRAYRTGDLVRMTVDGQLEYVGRIDHQLKVNGVRIEPGEVEAALAAHPEVGGAVVTGYPSGDGGTRMAAYVLTKDGAVPARLREFLAERLPSTHLPAAYVAMTAFPLTRSGKVDRSALPAPDQHGTADHQPLSEAERLIGQVWQDLLKVDNVGADDDFFALGGSSLHLTRLANRIRKASGAPIDLSKLMTATTLAEQAALLAEVTTQNGDRIVAVPRDRDLPLSFGQSRMWVNDRMRPRSREWVSALFLRVSTGTTVDEVQQALNQLLARHETLRTRFTLRAGEAVQVIDPPGTYELRVMSHDEVPDADFHTALDQELDRGFDIASGPMTRALLRPEDDHQLLVISAHHIVLDGWSSAILERDFHELLGAVQDGRTPNLPPPALQYADFAAWQRNRLDDQVIAKELSYWRAVLEDAHPTTLRLDKPRPAVRDGRGAIVGFTVPAAVAKALDKRGRAASATPFMTLLTAFSTLLARYSSDWDVVVGTPLAGRDRPELENMVGFFLNNVVLRCALDPSMDFDAALAAVRNTCREAFAHQELPFDKLVAELAPERDLSRTPLYQVAFDLHDEKLTASAANPEDWATLIDVSRIAKTDLTLYLRAEPDGSMAGGLEYATALFERATIERMARHFLALLEALATDPGVALAEVDFVPGDERVVLEAAASGVPLAVDLDDTEAQATSLELFERQVGANPDAIAVACGPERVTYAQLDRRANQIAHRLRAAGAGPDSVIGVLLGRGTDMMAAFLGAWKSGAAYLPLDLDAPAERIEMVLGTAGASAVITTAALRSGLGGHVGTVVVLDQLDPADAPATGPARVVDPDLLAYTIYTSGSTGVPKGVQVTHRGLVNHLRWAVTELATRGRGGAPVFSSVAFDLVVPNLWAPLLAGQTVHMLPSDMDLTELGPLLRDLAPFSFIKLTPGHLEILSQQLNPDWVADLAGVIVVAGQALPQALASDWTAMLGPDRLINEYGPSEATVGTCTYPVGAAAGAQARDTVPIGKPLPGVTMRVLDDLMRPVPVGVVGEVYVGGTGLARGYAGAPGMTADRFMPDPFATDGGRLYRTGDLAEVLPSGDVSFIGRRDDQVKIRGYRVELGEIATVLRGHEAVADAVVLADTTDSTGSGDVRLRAFVVPEAGAGQPSADELVEVCRRRLPAYMVPTTCTLIDHFPLNANGKLDTKALVALAGTVEPELAAPAGEVELHIAEVFADLLGHEVGADSDFFRSGGNSILAIRLVAAIQDAYEIELPIRAVFEGPTVAKLAEIVESRVREG
ncbi:non-ribosomal peptide synthetase [Labedaea rhizosphaerae]|uniref:Amino acid adenylation domain-containing protein n=1 Tax=Labedaea rhizosphaerae TaxID=598644 RepID=A0A4R6SGM3_LABRH|nr:non-ribosomal peptide synthetase [Labedaea rhizosphaerae]TDQ00506.1 amino acid adenylation domain-containing protein [Labedaea rhizosphaerae]